MKSHKSKQEILDDLSKKELGDGIDEYINFWTYWYDGEQEFEDYEFYDYFYDWLNDPIRHRDDKLDELLGISRNVTIGDYIDKKLDNNK